MGRRVLIVVLVLAVALFAYVGYNSYDARRSGANGDVFSPDGSTKLKIETEPEITGNHDGRTVVYPDETGSARGSQPVVPSADPQPVGEPTALPARQGAPPASDTVAPNPPDGMVFAGTGKYQVYRQGNLTWRINTATGQSCILFATDEEWKKPKVYRSGCRGANLVQSPSK